MKSLGRHSTSLICTSTSFATGRRKCNVMRGIKENVAALPSADHISSITLQPLGHTIPNAPGKKASVTIYNYLAQKYSGTITEEAAKEGIELYGEYVAEAKAQPGSHPNIDILLDVLSKQQHLNIVLDGHQ